MNDDKMAELVLKITSELATLNAHMKVVLDRLSLHEQRITALEQHKVGMTDALISWLVKGLIASVMIIGSLTGASALIKGVFGM